MARAERDWLLIRYALSSDESKNIEKALFQSCYSADRRSYFLFGSIMLSAVVLPMVGHLCSPDALLR